MARLLPQVQRALQLHRRAGHLAWTSAAALSSVDQLGVAFIAACADGRVLVVNALAERLMDGRGLGIRAGRLHARTGAATATLRAAISRAASADPNDRQPGAIVAVDRVGGTTLTVLVTPLPLEHALNGFGRVRAAAVFVTDPDAGAPNAEHWLRAAYGLTAAEARLLLALVDGHSLQEAARLCAVTNNTARWHLKHVTSKMGVSRQSQAVALAVRQLPLLRGQG